MRRLSLFVVAAYGKILRPDVLAIPDHGTLNVHASLLPAYRGASPINAAILEGEPETGVTIMLMDVGLDTGPVLAQARVAIPPDATTATLTATAGGAWCAAAGRNGGTLACRRDYPRRRRMTRRQR